MTTVTNHDVLTLFRRATAEFATRAHSIGDRWSAPTPCTGWDVRALVHHVVENQCRAGLPKANLLRLTQVCT